MQYHTTIDEQEYQIEILDDRHVRIGDVVHEMDFVSISGQPVYSLIIDGKSFEAYVYPEDEYWQVLLVGRQYCVKVVEEREARLNQSRTNPPVSGKEYSLKAPMPGMVISIPVKEGQRVDKGDILLVLESMKMQNELRSPRAGVVTLVRAKTGETVEQKQLLLSLI